MGSNLFMKIRGLYQFIQNIASIVGIILLGSEMRWSGLTTFSLILIVLPVITLLMDIRGLLWKPDEAKKELDR